VVSVARPGTAPVQKYLLYNGHLEAVEMVEIRARVKGFLDEVFFKKEDGTKNGDPKYKEGDEVPADTPLYKIDPREYQSAVARSKSEIARAVADLASANAQVQLAEAELTRLKAGGPSVSKSELDKAVATLAANRAQVDVATANRGSAEAALRTAELQLSYTDIRAPIAGRISRTQVTRGNLVGQTAESTLLTTIVSVDPVYVYFDAPERDLVEYQRALKDMAPSVGQGGASIPVLVGVTTEDGFPHAGAIDFRENRVDTGTGTVRVRGRVPNPLVPPGNARLLYPGLFARVRVPNGPERPRLVIPEDALMTGQEGRFVYVVGAGNKVQKRTVTVGPQVWRAPPPAPDAKPDPNAWTLAPPAPPADGKPGPQPAVVRSAVAVLSGLKADDVVIVSGLQKARPGAPVAPETWALRGPAK
jgi:RND family efflux transporter MFP subunit